MNLMFWKKKNGAAEKAEDAPKNLAMNNKQREPLDFVAAQKDDTGRDPDTPESEPSGAGEDGSETATKPGWVARIGARLHALTKPFKKPQVFRAEVEPEASGDAGKPGDAEPAEPEMSAKPELAMRIKLQLVTLLRRFRKPTAPDDGEDQADHPSDESPAPEAPAKPGLLARIKAGFAAFVREIKVPAAPAADEKNEEEADSHSRSATEPEEEPSEDVPVRSRKWLVIGGAITIVVLLAADIAITLWMAYEPPQKRWGTKHDMTSIPSRSLDSDSATEESPISEPGKSQVEAEALKKENAELQARIKALQQAQQSRLSAPLTRQNGGNTAGSPVAVRELPSGELAIGSDDPKATAMSLKEAIEAMNAAEGGKSAK